MTESALPRRSGRERISLPTRLFLVFAVVVVGFTAVAISGLVQHERTGRALERLHDGYLPLAMQLGEARATQGVLSAFLDRVRNEQDTAASRSWLEAARRRRPSVVRRARQLVDHLSAAPATLREARTLRRLRVALAAAERETAASERVLGRLVTSLASGRLQEGGGALLERARERERRIQRHLGTAWRLVRLQVVETGRGAAEQQRRAAALLAAATGGALLLGLVALWWTRRVLAPLRDLVARVQAVARGDWRSKPLSPRREDELGRLAVEFERMVEALERTKERLLRTERLAAVGKLAAHVTHEVRNPLSSLALNVELLEEELAAAPEETRGILEAVQREIDRLTELTEGYLRLARLPDPVLETRDVGDVVRATVDFLLPEFERAGVRCELHMEAGGREGLVALVDEAKLRQALLNLLRNAREASGHGGMVRLGVRAEEAWVCIEIEDDGPGVPPEVRDRIFDVFFTTKERGTGLGLPLAQQIVLAHGGSLRCEDVPGGRGARFVLRLPRHPAPVGEGVRRPRMEESRCR